MSVNGKISGETSDFSYQISCVGNTEPNTPISGFYQGYFWMKYKPPQKIVENRISIQFNEEGGNYVVTGSGSNRFGIFDLHGVYDSASHELNCYKEYHQKPKPHRSESTKETRSSSRYVLFIY